MKNTTSSRKIEESDEEVDCEEDEVNNFYG